MGLKIEKLDFEQGLKMLNVNIGEFCGGGGVKDPANGIAWGWGNKFEYIIWFMV